MKIDEGAIAKLERFQAALADFDKNRSLEARKYINQNAQAIRRELVEARCFQTYTISPPPAVGGLIMRNVDPITALFDPPYGMNMNAQLSDMIDRAIGVIREGPPPSVPIVEQDIARAGYVFIAMPMDAGNRDLDDVHDAIKQAASNCGMHAERVDEIQSNERITDRILESIRKAQFVVADLTLARPNVFYEAGYANGLQKTPIYVAREGTKLEFDLKDYPVIFFSTLRDLRDGLEKRLRALAAGAK